MSRKPYAVLLEPLVGREVVLEGLSSRKDLNGKQCMCLEYRADSQRYVVRIKDTGNTMAVPLKCVSSTAQEDVPNILSSLRGCISHQDGRTFQFGRSLLPGDFVSMFVERCKLESKKTNLHTSCAVCDNTQGPFVTCGGCGLCHWCDNDTCQRHGVEAGHGKLCQQLRALWMIFYHDEIQQARKLFHSEDYLEGNALMYKVSRKLSLGLDQDTANVIFTCCNAAIQWPASSEMATCKPGTKYRLDETQLMDFQFGGMQAKKAVPGKLTFCASSHKKTYKELSKKQLKQTHTLPCGQDPCAGKSKGITGDLMHAPIQASLKELSLREFQQMLCESCNSQPDMMGGKSILSDVYYSYCLQRVVNSNGLPGAIQHCPSCGLCGDYMYGHCMRCDKCSYGTHLQVMPCMHCHDLEVVHDGVLFIPATNRQCDSGRTMAIFAQFQCKCGNGECIFNDPAKDTRQPLALPKGMQKSSNRSSSSSSSPVEDTGLSEEDIVAAIEHGVESMWISGQSDPVQRVKNIDDVLRVQAFESQTGSKDLSELTRQRMEDTYGVECPMPDAGASITFAGLKDAHDEGRKLVGLLRDKFKAQYQNEKGRDNNDVDFITWLTAQREKAAAECKARRASGVPGDYKEVFAKRCDFCNTKATAFKALKTCVRCKTAYYCDAECQKKAWPKHKKVCKKSN